MRRLLLATLFLAVPALSGCSVYAQDAYAYDGYGYSAYAAVPGPVYYGYRGSPAPRGYYRGYRGYRGFGHRASAPRGFKGGYGRRPGPGGGGHHGPRGHR